MPAAVQYLLPEVTYYLSAAATWAANKKARTLVSCGCKALARVT